MDSPYNPLEFSLLNDWQRDFPLVAQPFAEIAAKVSRCDTAGPAPVGESEVLTVLQHLARRGAISRVGAVFAPRRVGAGALAAVAAPPERIEEIAALINAFPSVNHNYQREHVYNLWFVVTACDQTQLAQTFADITAVTGCAVIAMPLAEEFHIDLGFDLNSGHSRIKHDRPCTTVQRELSAQERRLAAVLQDGLTLVAHPYAALAERAGSDEVSVLHTLRSWQDEGLIKRFGVVVRHHEMGYRANAMVVFDVPDEQASRIGKALASEAGVTLAYRRERCLPAWPYNLYCMVHGRTKEEVLPIVQRLSAIAGHEATILFSTRRFKQCGARYF